MGVGHDHPGTYVLTVHGIGPYDASRGASSRLVDALDADLRTTLRPVDFNWHVIVEGIDFKDEVTQLARSVQEAAHLGTEGWGIAKYLVRVIGFVFEALFKLSVMAVPVSASLLICAIPIYTRFRSFGVAGAATPIALRWTAMTWAASAVLFAAGLILAGVLRIVGLRVDSAALLRRMLLLPLQPVIPLAYRLSETETRNTVRGIALFAVGYGVLTGAIAWWSPDVAAQWSGLGFKSLSVGAAGLAVIVTIGQRISRVISVPLKLARDIFNYIGDVEQRVDIQDRLHDTVSRIPAGAHVILVGHSLGSVIALDSLCNDTAWARLESVSVVTCGSPVARFFQRFFPGLYFPSEADECCRLIQSQSRVVCWLNVYRAGWRGDPVGQALFARGGTGTDVPVVQNERVLMNAHVDYWDDPFVIDAVRSAWGQLPPPLVAVPEQPSDTPVWHGALFDLAAYTASKALVLCAFLGCLLGVANAFAIVQQRRQEARDFVARADASGVETSAEVTHSTTTWGYGEDLAFPVQVYEFMYADRDGVVNRLTFRENEGSGFDGGLYFNSEAFRKSIGREERSTGAQTFDARIVRLEGDASHLVLADPQFRPVQSGFPVFEVLWTGVGSIIWLMALFQFGVFAASMRIAEAVLPHSTR